MKRTYQYAPNDDSSDDENMEIQTCDGDGRWTIDNRDGISEEQQKLNYDFDYKILDPCYKDLWLSFLSIKKYVHKKYIEIWHNDKIARIKFCGENELSIMWEESGREVHCNYVCESFGRLVFVIIVGFSFPVTIKSWDHFEVTKIGEDGKNYNINVHIDSRKVLINSSDMPIITRSFDNFDECIGIVNVCGCLGEW